MKVTLKTREVRTKYDLFLGFFGRTPVMEQQEAVDFVDELEQSIKAKISLEVDSYELASYWIFSTNVDTNSKAYKTLTNKGWKISTT